MPLLAQIPIDIATRESGDRGLPVAAADRHHPVSVVFGQISETLRRVLESGSPSV